jgi:hypothetical protein
MCNPFFHQFRVIPSAYGFQLVCCTASLVTTELYAGALTLIGILLTLAGLEGQWAMIYLVMEAWKSRLLGLSCETLLILASAAIFHRKLHYSHDHQSNMNGMQGQNFRVPLPSLWCSLCHLYIWAGIFKNSMGARHRVGIGLSYRPAMLHYRLAELMPWHRFLGSIKV